MLIKDKHSIVESAARWHARLSAPDCTEEERVRCADWRQQDPAHEQAFTAAEGLSRMLAQFGGADTRLRAMADLAYAAGASGTAGRPRRTWQRFAMPAALAAAAALVAVALAPTLGLKIDSPKTANFAASNQRQDVTLADGTLVHLDVQSSIKVRLASHARQVDLVAGRAFFEVAHDASRPFTVSTGNEHITALGTRFQVDRQDPYVVVTLDEGSIAVTDASADGQDRRIVLRPGEQIKVSMNDGARVLREVDTQTATSWSHGRLLFRATPLAEALAEVNRYADRKVRLGDASLAELPVSGSFIPGNSELTVSALAAVLPIKAVEANQEIMLFRSPKAESEARGGDNG